MNLINVIGRYQFKICSRLQNWCIEKAWDAGDGLKCRLYFKIEKIVTYPVFLKARLCDYANRVIT